MYALNDYNLAPTFQVKALGRYGEGLGFRAQGIGFRRLPMGG